MLNRRFVIGSFLSAPLVRIAAAGAWPQRPIRILYPYAAGGSGDATARLIASRLSGALGQGVIVENRVGANGIIAAETVARATADGYTLLWAVTPQIAIAPRMSKVPYDPVNDFAPVSAVATNRFALVVNTKVPASSIAEFVDYIRAQPNGLTYAEGGTGSVTHLAMVLFLKRAGLSGTNVSYKGTAPAILDVVAGRIPAMFAVFGDALSQAKSGAIRILAVSSEQRSQQASNVPTVAEAGYPGFSAISWWGLMAPAGTPREIVERIALEVSHATHDPKIVAQFANFGVDAIGNTPAEFAAMIAADNQLWSEAVKLAGLAL